MPHKRSSPARHRSQWRLQQIAYLKKRDHRGCLCLSSGHPACSSRHAPNGRLRTHPSRRPGQQAYQIGAGSTRPRVLPFDTEPPMQDPMMAGARLPPADRRRRRERFSAAIRHHLQHRLPTGPGWTNGGKRCDTGHPPGSTCGTQPVGRRTAGESVPRGGRCRDASISPRSLPGFPGGL